MIFRIVNKNQHDLLYCIYLFFILKFRSKLQNKTTLKLCGNLLDEKKLTQELLRKLTALKSLETRCLIMHKFEFFNRFYILNTSEEKNATLSSKVSWN